MRTDILFTWTTKPTCNFANPDMFKSKSIVFKQDMQIKAKFVPMKMK